MRSKNEETLRRIELYLHAREEDGENLPTVRDIAAGTGIPRPTVQRYLVEMDARGMLSYNGGLRSTTRTRKMTGAFSVVALVGEISCGGPHFAEEDIEQYYRLPRDLTGPGEFFLLRAKGESMIGAGIEEDDLVLIRKQDYATAGDIVVALTEEETTLKRYYPEPEHRRVRLHPENPTMRDIYLTDIQIQGVAVMVMKDLRS